MYYVIVVRLLPRQPLGFLGRSEYTEASSIGNLDSMNYLYLRLQTIFEQLQLNENCCVVGCQALPSGCQNVVIMVIIMVVISCQWLPI